MPDYKVVTMAHNYINKPSDFSSLLESCNFENMRNIHVKIYLTYDNDILHIRIPSVASSVGDIGHTLSHHIKLWI